MSEIQPVGDDIYHWTKTGEHCWVPPAGIAQSVWEEMVLAHLAQHEAARNVGGVPSLPPVER